MTKTIKKIYLAIAIVLSGITTSVAQTVTVPSNCTVVSTDKRQWVLFLTINIMKRTILSVFFLFSFFFTTAQKELWGNNKIQSYIDYSDPTNPITLPYYGNITKYDINGDNGTVVHVFDGINGKLPTGKLFHASNGKLYGLTSAYTSSTGLNDDVCLFEYDLILNKFNCSFFGLVL